jgi:hypothetical protein
MLMNICPLCNGLRNIKIACQNCGNQLEDMGKLTDFFGDYSPYMGIDMMKMVDGYQFTYQQHQCPHLFYCSQCGRDEVRLINE